MNEIKTLIEIARALAPHLPADGITLRAGDVEITIRPTFKPQNGPDIEALASKARRLIEAGELPANPSASKIRRVLRVGTDTARALRDELAGGASS